MRFQDIQEDIILLIEPYLLDPIFTREIMMSKSVAAANLAYWVINDDILMRGGYTGTGVRKATDVSESASCFNALTDERWQRCEHASLPWKRWAH